jgi:hypothetical protein
MSVTKRRSGIEQAGVYDCAAAPDPAQFNTFFKL